MEPRKIKSATVSTVSPSICHEVMVKAVYCHPAYLTSMQSTSRETLDWKKHKLESRFPGEISITSDNADDTSLMVESKEELKTLLMKVKE